MISISSNYNTSSLEDQVNFLDKIVYHVVTTYSDTQRRMIDKILKLANINDTVYISHESLAKVAGCTADWAQKSTNIFDDHQIIAKEYHHRKACVYVPAPWFYNLTVRKALSKYFPSLRWIPVKIFRALFIPDNKKRFEKVYNDKSCLSEYSGPFPSGKQEYLYSNRTVRITREIGFDKREITRARDGTDNSTWIEKSSNRERTARFLKKTGERRIMNQFNQHWYPDNPIPPYIRAVTELQLSKWGQIKLTAFPDAAIEHARFALKTSRNAKDPFGLFFWACQQYCKDNGIRPDFGWVDSMAKQYEMPENAPMMIAKERPEDKKKVLTSTEKWEKQKTEGVNSAVLGTPHPTEDIQQVIQLFEIGMKNEGGQQLYHSRIFPVKLIQALAHDEISAEQKEHLLNSYPLMKQALAIFLQKEASRTIQEKTEIPPTPLDDWDGPRTFDEAMRFARGPIEFKDLVKQMKQRGVI